MLKRFFERAEATAAEAALDARPPEDPSRRLVSPSEKLALSTLASDLPWQRTDWWLQWRESEAFCLRPQHMIFKCVLDVAKAYA